MEKKAFDGGKFAIRIVMYVLGLFLVAIAIRLALVAGLGLPACASLSYGLSQPFNLAFGKFDGMSVWTFITNMICLAVQIAILRKKFKPISLLQIPLALLFSTFLAYVDPIVMLWGPASTYIEKFIQMIVSVILMGLGTFFAVFPNLIAQPPESMMIAILTKVKSSVGTLRICYDVISLVLGVLFALIALKSIGAIIDIGLVREGTVISAVLTGAFVSIFGKLLGKPLGKLCFGSNADENKISM